MLTFFKWIIAVVLNLKSISFDPMYRILVQKMCVHVLAVTMPYKKSLIKDLLPKPCSFPYPSNLNFLMKSQQLQKAHLETNCSINILQAISSYQEYF